MPQFQVIGRVRFYWTDGWLEREVDRRVEAPGADAAIALVYADWDAKVRRNKRSDRPDLSWIGATPAVHFSAISIQVGGTVVRKVDRAMPNAIRGTVDRIRVLGAQPQHWKAVVL
jgi:hypothetical protein